MEKPKRITLQEYIECQNIKRQLQARSKSKSRSKSNSKMPEKQLTVHSIDTAQQIDKSISEQTTDKMARAYVSIEEYITEIKFFAREHIKSDKSFAQLSRMLNQLSKQFKLFMMKIHRQNLVMFQIKNQNSREDLQKSILAKSFNAKFNQSKQQYEQTILPLGKTIKQKIVQDKKTQEMLTQLMMGKKVSSEYSEQQKNIANQEPSLSKSKGGFIQFMLRNHIPKQSQINIETTKNNLDEQNIMKKDCKKEEKNKKTQNAQDKLIKSINQVNQLPKLKIKEISKQKRRSIDENFQKQKQKNEKFQNIKKNESNIGVNNAKSQKNLKIALTSPQQILSNNKNIKKQQSKQLKSQASPLPNLFSFMLGPPNEPKEQILQKKQKIVQLGSSQKMKKKQSLQKKRQRQKQLIKKTTPQQKSKSKGKPPVFTNNNQKIVK